MSIRINVTVAVDVPLETAATIQNTGDVQVGNAINEVYTSTSQAVIDAVRALPYKIEPKPFNILVRSLLNRSHRIQVRPDDTAATVANRYMDLEGVPVNQQRLIYNGVQLQTGFDEDDDWVERLPTLQELGITQDTTLHVIGLFRGS